MRFAFTDDQLAFAEAVRELLADHGGPTEVRAAWDSDDGRVPGLWGRLAEMGVVGLLAPEGTDGMGLSDLDLVRILHEAGRACLPEPLAATAAVAVPAIRDHAESSDAERWLGRIARGEVTIGVGLAGNPAVLYASDAAAFLLEADDGLHLVDADVVELTPRESVDGSRRLSVVSWNPSPATRLSGGEAAVQQAHDRAAVATAAELCGLADTMLEMTVGYVTERRQFGVPIGSFQAIKHHLADAFLAVEFAKPLVWRAAYSLTHNDPEASMHASMAKAAASDAAATVSAQALQCHGAIAYTVEYDLQLWLKRGWALAAAWGSARDHRRRLATLVL